jgi:hypothetical protein
MHEGRLAGHWLACTRHSRYWLVNGASNTARYCHTSAVVTIKEDPSVNPSNPTLYNGVLYVWKPVVVVAGTPVITVAIGLPEATNVVKLVELMFTVKLVVLVTD